MMLTKAQIPSALDCDMHLVVITHAAPIILGEGKFLMATT